MVGAIPELTKMRRARGQVRERGDALPEHIQYRDTGCDLSPSCLNCTLPLCRYDQPPEPPGTAYRAARRLCMIGRDEEIVRLRRCERLPVDALAHRFGLSRRTVHNILKRSADILPDMAHTTPEPGAGVEEADIAPDSPVDKGVAVVVC